MHIQKDEGSGFSFGRRNDVKFNSLADFLWVSESEFWAMGTRHEPNSIMHKLVHDLQFRRLLKRVMVISRKTVKVDDGLKELQSHRHKDNPVEHKKLRELAGRICEEANKKGKKCDVAQIWVDLPPVPRVTSLVYP